MGSRKVAFFHVFLPKSEENLGFPMPNLEKAELGGTELSLFWGQELNGCADCSLSETIPTGTFATRGAYLSRCYKEAWDSAVLEFYPSSNVT